MNSSPFASPLGPLHLAHPSQATQFVLPLPSSSSRIRSFFRSTSSSSAKSSQAKKQKKETLKIEIEDRKGSTYSPLQTPSSPPPSYRQAVGKEEDLYCEEAESNEELDMKKQALIEQDERMNEALKSIGF
ncbi:uncharacterized protein JCM6883_006854 [Sporobolomyces salmoneus]|uniref:uncharacterized protein n=1 Tax=Sporobolomyces salmoneus TaxID=183962 RepID=UPI00318119AB